MSPATARHFILPLVGLLLLALASGCTPRSRDYVQPSVAVLAFDNHAGGMNHWEIGGGMRDILTDRLVKTGRYQVIERPNIDALLREIQLQNSDATRPQDRAKPGQLKNVQYLIKGTITDFGHTGGIYGDAASRKWSASASASVATLGLNLYVINVETGEVVASERIQESVPAGRIDVHAVYKDVAFGGGVFFKTPLGKATSHAIDRAVKKITASIASQPWQPKVAAIAGDAVLINGGLNHGLRAGDRLEVLTPGTPVLDPDTGDPIGRQPDRLIARLRITEVQDRHAAATLEDGALQNIAIGMLCRRP